MGSREQRDGQTQVENLCYEATQVGNLCYEVTIQRGAARAPRAGVAGKRRQDAESAAGIE
jgi:hypothetical protein